MKYPVSISVVMPCFNYGKFVSSAIESILQQSFENFELIIINDGSGDNSHEEIIKYSDKRIRYVSLKENRGNFPARNIGMRMAEGKYICVMDADDISHKDRLAIQFSFLEKKPNIGAIGSQGEWLNENGSPTHNLFKRPVCSWPQFQIFLLLDSQAIHPSLMFRKHLLEKHDLYYNESYSSASDYDFLIRCASLFPVHNIETVLLYYRSHPHQISRKKRSEQRNYADEIRIKQLGKLLERPSLTDVETYLQLMKRLPFLNKQELDNAYDLSNNILASNYKLKIYNQNLLYDLFDYLISEAKEKLLNITESKLQVTL